MTNKLYSNSRINELNRIDISYFEGANLFVSNNLCRKEEFTFCENARAMELGTVEKRGGTRRKGNDISATANNGLVFFDHHISGNSGLYRFSTVGGVVNPYYLSTATPAIWTKINTALTADRISTTIAENCLFCVNGNSNNFYIPGSTGNTVVDSTSASGHFYGAPKAKKVNYFKERLYLGDFTDSNGTRYPNGIMMSSIPLGIMALADGDTAAGTLTVPLTDTKYIRTSDSLDVYRGGTKIETLTVTGKTETTITVSANASGILSADEIWPANTATGTRLFRWSANTASGENVKLYDTFQISGGQSDALHMMVNIGDVMLLANSRNLATWDGSSVVNLDNGIGCVSDRGYTKAANSIFFLGYRGIYSTSGEAPILISSKVQPLIDGATKAGLEAAAMGTKGNSIFCHIGSSTLYNPDGSVSETLTNVVLEKDLKTQNWYVHTGIVPSQFETFIDATTPDSLLYASNSTGYHIFEFLTNDTVDDAGSTDKEIFFRVDTARLPVAADFEKFGYVYKVLARSEAGASMSCFVSFDDEPFYELSGNIVKGVNILNVKRKGVNDSGPVKCHKVKMSFRDCSKQRCRLANASIMFSATEESENKKK